MDMTLRWFGEGVDSVSLEVRRYLMFWSRAFMASPLTQRGIFAAKQGMKPICTPPFQRMCANRLHLFC